MAAGRGAAAANDAVNTNVLGAGAAAWRVTAEANHGQAVRVVVAPSLAEAASQAEAAGIGQIVSLEWIGAIV